MSQAVKEDLAQSRQGRTEKLLRFPWRCWRALQESFSCFAPDNCLLMPVSLVKEPQQSGMNGGRIVTGRAPLGSLLRQVMPAALKRVEFRIEMRPA
jgi:hypothetical protein